MIITLTNDKINIDSENFCCTLDSDALSELKFNRFIPRRTLSYTFLINNRELRLDCPVLGNTGAGNVVLWPAIKLPFRKYPVYVYLYSVALYLSTDFSMRDVASIVRQKYGLDKFSHTTVLRALKRLSGIADELMDIMKTVASSPDTGPEVVKRSRWSYLQLTEYGKLLHLLHPVLDKSRSISYSSLLSYKYFNHFMKFVI